MLALVKYAFMGNELPTTFIVFEILSFFVVLYIIYYMLNYIETCMHGTDDANMDKECIKRQAEISRLTNKLSRLEQEKNADNQGYEADNDVLLAKIQSKLRNLKTQTVGEILDLITEQHEVMAAVGYYRNGDEPYLPVKTFGVDEEIEMAPIDLEDGLHAQAIRDKKAMEITDVPADYIEVGSGSGAAKPFVLYILPIVNSDSGMVLEIAAFKKLNLVDMWNQLEEAL